MVEALDVRGATGRANHRYGGLVVSCRRLLAVHVLMPFPQPSNVVEDGI